MAEQRQVQNNLGSEQRRQNFQTIGVTPASINPTENQALPSESSQIVQGLVQFAGVAGGAYKARLDKQIEEDKIIQSQQAQMGLLPTDDATRAGYEAHMQVAVKNNQLKAQARLNQAAEGDYTDEEWEQVIRDTYAEADDAMVKDYPNYGEFPESQKLLSLSMAEIMPQVQSKRESVKLDREQLSRMNNETDVLLNELGVSDDYDTLIKRSKTRMDAMRLSPDQQEKVIMDLVINSEDLGAIELSKRFKGAGRSSTLYERKGQIKAKEEQLVKEKQSYNAGELGLEVSQFQQAVLAGEYTPDEVVKMVDKRNKETSNKFMSQSGVTSLLNQASTQIAKRTRQNAIVNKLQNTDSPVITGATKPEVEVGLTQGYQQYMQAGVKAITKNVSDPMQQAQEIRDLTARATQMWGDKSATLGFAIPSWTGSFSGLANTNVAASAQEGDVGRLSQQQEEAYQQLEYMTPSTQDFYLSSMNSREADILRNSLALREVGMTSAQALQTAQQNARNPIPRSASEIEKAITDITESIDDGIFVDDIPDYAKPYYMAEVRKKVAAHPNPTSDSAKAQIKGYFDKNWTTLESGLRVRGSTGQLQQLTKLNAANLDKGFSAMVNSHKEDLLPYLETYGLDWGDVIPDVDPKAGMVRFVGPNGEPLNAMSYPLTEVKTSWMKYKTELEKKRDAEAEYWKARGGM